MLELFTKDVDVSGILKKKTMDSIENNQINYEKMEKKICTKNVTIR